LIFCFLKFEIKLIRFADEGSVRNEGRRRIKDEFQAGPVFKASLGKKLAGPISNNKLGMVAFPYNPIYAGGQSRRITAKAHPG
jgi:hypothetical protein